MSPTNPEVHKVSQCHQKKSEPRPQATCIKYLVKFSRVVFKLYKQTDRHTYQNTLHSFWGQRNELKDFVVLLPICLC